MVVGFNHNFCYKGEVYHVQTEDGGVKSAQIVTLLYCGGTILAAKKSSYAHLGQQDNLAALVENLMKEQHREMLRQLKNGEFDPIIEKYARPKDGDDIPSVPSEQTLVAQAPDLFLEERPPAKPLPIDAELDKIILSYLLGDDY
ncbi:MAG: hypothetical protein P8X63_12670 [Desulfuromonadaceae bacterium]|jgi:hypothetical protein